MPLNTSLTCIRTTRKGRGKGFIESTARLLFDSAELVISPGRGQAGSVTSSTVPVNTAAALPAPEHGVPWPTHEQARSRLSGTVINAIPRSIRIRTFSQKPEGLRKLAWDLGMAEITPPLRRSVDRGSANSQMAGHPEKSP